MAKKIAIVCAINMLSALLLTGCSASQEQTKTEANRVNIKRIVLIGASVGKTWDLPGYPKRGNDNSAVFESLAVYQYDKTEVLEEVLMRPKRKFRLTRTYIKGFFEPAPKLPDVIIIKECSAYFPGEFAQYQELIKQWVKRIRDARIQVILATAVPVTHDRAEKTKGKIEGIKAFNDWIRGYAKSENILLLDLEAALRIGAGDRYLRDDLTSGDGTHLNKKAYDILDTLLQKTVHSNASML